MPIFRPSTSADITEQAAPDIGVPLNIERLRTPRRPDEKRWRMQKRFTPQRFYGKIYKSQLLP